MMNLLIHHRVDLPTLRLLPGNSAEATLFWQTQPVTTSYTAFLHLLDPNDNLISQKWLPVFAATRI